MHRGEGDVAREQGIYLDSLGCEHLTLPEPEGAVWPQRSHDGRQSLRLIRVDPAE